MLVETVRAPETNVFCSHPVAETWVSPSRSNGNSNRAGARDEPAVLVGSGVTVKSGPELEKVFLALYEGSRQVTGGSNFAVAMYDNCADTLTFPLIFDRGIRAASCSIRLSNERSLVSCTFTALAPLLIQDLSKTGIVIETDPICPAQSVRSWLSVPIYNPMLPDERAQGVMILWSQRPNAFTHQQLQLLSAMAAQAAVVIGNASLHENRLAERDRAIEIGEHIRRALARDLHDGPLQLVGSLLMRLDFCHRVLEEDPASLPEQINYMEELAEHAVHQMRTLLFELRPIALETEGLGPALQVLLDRYQMATTTTRLTLNIDTYRPGGTISRLGVRVEAAIFAIVQEAVNNALKHARASHIKVYAIEASTAIKIIIVDDGQGFEVDEVLRCYERLGSLGIVNMQERAESIGGELEIKSMPGRGTYVTIYVVKEK